MKSILENRPGLAKEVNKVAEVAVYLWHRNNYESILYYHSRLQ